MNRTFIRNIIIIFVLIFAIGVVNEKVNAKKRRVEEERVKAAQVEAETKALNEKKREEARLAQQAQMQSTPQLKLPDQGNEDSMTSLLRLQADLKAGERTEFPKGCLQIGTSHFYLVSKPMGWTDAWAYANQFGARLAVLKELEDGQKIVSSLSNPEGCWLGAGDHGNGVYSWVDGSNWEFDPSIQVKNTFLVLNSFGKIEPGRANKKLPFLMEWTPSARVKGSLDSVIHTFEPRFSPLPVGSIRVGKQAYFVMPWQGKPEEASAFANRLGGWLATAGTPEEAKMLIQLVRYRVELGKKVLIGGVEKEGQWTWGSGEEWKKSVLSFDSPTEGQYLGILSDQEERWVTLSKGDEISYLLVEWGEKPVDLASKTSNQGEESVPPMQLPQENPEAVEAIRQLRGKLKVARGSLEKFDKLLKDNTQDLKFDLRTWLRGLPRGEREAVEPQLLRIERQMGDVQIRRVSQASALPQRAYELYQGHLRTQDRILTDRLDGVKKIQEGYKKLIEDQKKIAMEKKQMEVVAALDRELERCEGDTEEFLEFLER